MLGWHMGHQEICQAMEHVMGVEPSLRQDGEALSKALEQLLQPQLWPQRRKASLVSSCNGLIKDYARFRLDLARDFDSRGP